MGNKSSKTKRGDLSDEKRPNKKRTSFRDSLRSLTKRDRQPEPEITEDTGEKVQLEIPVEKYSFPFENVVFEGGGYKSLAYCGAVRVLEELDVWPRINRVAGSSSGAMTAALLAVGYNSYQLERYLSQDLRDMFTDHCCGCCSFSYNVRNKLGWNPAHKFYKWFGEKIKEATGSPDTTFLQVYQTFGRELCIAVTNVSRLGVEYCHPKTTPDMPVRLAVRMSMTIPGLIQPVKHKLDDFLEYYVDGGLLCNYPVNCYDGWWLSMRSGDSFLEKISPLADLPKLLDPDHRFGGYNQKTLGFMVYADHEKDVLQAALDTRATYLKKQDPPNSTLAKSRGEKKESRKNVSDKYSDLSLALKNLLKALADHGLGSNTTLSRNDMQNILSKRTELSDIDVRILFGKYADAETIFHSLDVGKTDQLEISKLIRHLDRRGLRYLSHYMDYKRRDISSVGDYIMALDEVSLITAGRSGVQKRDLDRTVGINTDHVSATDHALQREDRLFLVEQGKLATKDYLEHYVVSKAPALSDARKDDDDDDIMTQFLDDDISEIIDHRDYIEDYCVKII